MRTLDEMTTKQMMKLIGRSCAYTVRNGCEIFCTIEDVKIHWGTQNFKIVPKSGVGYLWTTKVRILDNDSI